jgi:hypothetical protein
VKRPLIWRCVVAIGVVFALLSVVHVILPALVSRGIWSGLSFRKQCAVQALIGAAAIAGVCALRGRRRTTALVALASFAVLFSQVARPVVPYVHRWELFHHVLGARYAEELRYDALYICAAVAQSETETASEVSTRKIRDLETDVLVPASQALIYADACHLRFADRWVSFRRDVSEFREQQSGPVFALTNTDHGYNAPPTWSLLIRPILGEHSGELHLRALCSLDLVLVALMLAVVHWALGTTTCAIVAIVLATQVAGGNMFTQAAFLRLDWMVFSIVGLVVARRGHARAAGVCLGIATALRLFPCLFLLSYLVAALARRVQTKRWRPSDLQLLGFASATVSLLLLASLARYGVRLHLDYLAHLRSYVGISVMNHVGMPTLIDFSPSARSVVLDGPKDSYAAFTAARHALASSRAGIRLAIGAVVTAVVLVRILRKPSRARMGSTTLPLIFLLRLPSYYWSIFTLLATERRFRTFALGLAVASNLAALPRFAGWDDAFLVQTVVYGLATLYTFRSFTYAPRRRAA